MTSSALLSEVILVIESIWQIDTVSFPVLMPPRIVAVDIRWLLHLFITLGRHIRSYTRTMSVYLMSNVSCPSVTVTYHMDVLYSVMTTLYIL